jgi:hypothetical protein
MKRIYKIDRITLKDGTERTDGRYPLRKGCECSFYHLNEGDVMLLEYSKDNQGNDKSGYLRTSLVDGVSTHEKYIVVITCNSIYYFEYIRDEK